MKILIVSWYTIQDNLLTAERIFSVVGRIGYYGILYPELVFICAYAYACVLYNVYDVR